ncbi:unnamed protein product, partial [Discosporangium mesarthrocarpum]
GETYRVEVPGEQFWVDGGIRVTTKGYTPYYDVISKCWVAAGRCRAYLASSRPRVPLPRARWLELVCGIGDFHQELKDVGYGLTYLPISDADLLPTLFPVGWNLTFVAEHTGELICFANDAEGLYGNNMGAINATVTRESWPPNSTYAAEFEGFVATSPLVYP